ncbi:hypothetical protein CIB48_g8649 [Xylaria polymorpha]|nr:hypothetical protein CIB48_g8649 [Xylaria polymorpha]
MYISSRIFALSTPERRVPRQGEPSSAVPVPCRLAQHRHGGASAADAGVPVRVLGFQEIAVQVVGMGMGGDGEMGEFGQHRAQTGWSQVCYGRWKMGWPLQKEQCCINEPTMVMIVAATLAPAHSSLWFGSALSCCP